MWAGGLSKQIAVAKIPESSSTLSSITWADQPPKSESGLSATAEPGCILEMAKLPLIAVSPRSQSAVSIPEPEPADEAPSPVTRYKDEATI
jgi:hypothetical protein